MKALFFSAFLLAAPLVTAGPIFYELDRVVDTACEGAGIRVPQSLFSGEVVTVDSGPFTPMESVSIFVDYCSDQLMASPDRRERLGWTATEVTGQFSASAHSAAWCREIERLIGPPAP